MKILDRSTVSAAFDCRRIHLLGINAKLNHGHFQFIFINLYTKSNAVFQTVCLFGI